MNPRRPVAAANRDEAGFTVIELIVGLLISVAILAVLTNFLVVSVRSDKGTRDSVQSSTSNANLSAYFADDVLSVGPVAGADAVIRRDVSGCAGVPSLLRLTGPGKDSPVVVRSYHVDASRDPTRLMRQTCQGPNVNAALTATPRVRTIVSDLRDPNAVTVTCDTDAEAAPGDSQAVKDARCAEVSIDVVTKSERTLTAVGSMRSAVVPTPTTQPEPVKAPVSGTCTILADRTTWVGNGAQAGSAGENHAGEDTMHTYGAVYNSRSFFSFDLTSPCVEANPDWPTLPGGRNLTSVTLQMAFMGHNKGGLAIAYKPHAIEVVGPNGVWVENQITGNNAPSTMRSGSYVFDHANEGALTSHNHAVITNAVNGWYTGAWPNNGFRLSRNNAGDTLGKHALWATRFHPNASLHPRLVISWGP